MPDKTKGLKLTIIALLLALSIFVIGSQPARAVNAPTITEAQEMNVGQRQLMIKGIVLKGLEVLVYANGQLLGEAIIEAGNDIVNIFHFVTKAELPSLPYIIQTVSRDSATMEMSDLSNSIEINRTIPKVIIPKILKPQSTERLDSEQLRIVGLTGDNTKVIVFIDDKEDGSTVYVSDKSGTANFSYQTKSELVPGIHSIKALAEDRNGRKSDYSEIIKFELIINNPQTNLSQQRQSIINEATSTISNGKKGNISEEAAKEENIEVKGVEGEYDEKADEGARGEVSDLEIILNKKIGKGNATGTGLLTETQERMSRIKSNLLIFILFLMAVISWIIWVNRELVREKQKNEKETIKETAGIQNAEKANFDEDETAKKG